MRKSRLAAWCSLLAMLVNVGLAPAQTIFRNELKEKYDYRLVSCNTCHVSGKQKTVRNDFGSMFAKELEGKDVTERLKSVAELDRDDPKRQAMEEAVAKEFHEALKKIEAMKAPDGGTYGDALKAGTIEGVKLR